MNFQEKNQERRRVRDLFTATTPEGCCKVVKGESELHAKTKALVLLWLKNQDYECWCEANFKNGGRADLIAIHPNGNAFCFEILASESEKKLNEKEYPLPIIPVIAKDFKYSEYKF